MGGVGEGIFARGGRGVGEKVVGATRFELVTFCTPRFASNYRNFLIFV